MMNLNEAMNHFQHVAYFLGAALVFVAVLKNRNRTED